MQCAFCADSCCQYGVDVGSIERDRILARASEIVPLARAGVADWFQPEVTEDADFAGGSSFRTAVVDGRCVFLRRDARGCALHAVSLDTGTDYHLLKPMVSALFPVTFGDEAICCSEELLEGSLECISNGPTAYEMARDELRWYFGDDLIAELDTLAGTQSR